jgi:uncharacterized protein
VRCAGAFGALRALTDVVVFFFLLGVFARLAKSDLRLPEALYEALSIYLLLAIGLKGGVELARQPVAALLPEVLALVALGLAIPFLLYPALRAARLTGVDAAALAAHYGSVSVVTFAVATATLQDLNIGYESHAALWVAVMEAPGLLAGILLARMSLRGTTGSTRWGPLLHDVFFGKSVVLLLGGLAIGAVAGPEGMKPIEAVFVVPFKGVLALFLLELGLVAGAQLVQLKRYGAVVVAVGVLAPPLLAVAGALVGKALGLSTGGVALVATLAASASYIAAPTAMRVAVPQANAGLSITAALGVTFPFNVVLGIPMYIALARWLETAGP